MAAEIAAPAHGWPPASCPNSRRGPPEPAPAQRPTGAVSSHRPLGLRRPCPALSFRRRRTQQRVSRSPAPLLLTDLAVATQLSPRPAAAGPVQARNLRFRAAAVFRLQRTSCYPAFHRPLAQMLSRTRLSRPSSVSAMPCSRLPCVGVQAHDRRHSASSSRRVRSCRSEHQPCSTSCFKPANSIALSQLACTSH